MARRPRSQNSPWAECFRRAKFVWVPFLFTLLIGAFVIFFEKFSQQTATSSKILHWFKQSSKVISSSYPEWIPLWSINKPAGVIDRRLPSVNELDQDARRLLPLLDSLKEHKFFRIFKVNLAKECPFWARREMCTSPGSCQICECDNSQIPKPWIMQPVKNFVDRHHYNETNIKPWGTTDDRVDDDSNRVVDDDVSEIKRNLGEMIFGEKKRPTVSDEESSTASYVDLTLNRPGYTAYRGRNIWGLIYKENCMSPNPLKDSNVAPRNDELNECTEEEAFYKIVSGMQTVIMVLSAEYHHSKKTPEADLLEIEDLKRRGEIISASTFRSQYSPSLTLFKERVAPGREWMANLYFTFGVLLKTFCHVGPILDTCDCDTGTPLDDRLARDQLRSMLRQPFHACEDRYKDEPLFTRKQDLALRQFQNISKIMDCLECEKCRLHGKVKILALQMALKVGVVCDVQIFEILLSQAAGSDAKIRKRRKDVTHTHPIEDDEDSLETTTSLNDDDRDDFSATSSPLSPMPKKIKKRK
ncbi:uncharacterized protein LOC129617813 [Condylostylus longicornis]|uniref:uncharacterized protein LOC129617813 n=1 Tax=Condylostylus longicornis TaxID=2530218 RepID=UPI00244DB633|nr:uncharacterized protein LOC129617813 [Condylostylus longicornis]